MVIFNDCFFWQVALIYQTKIFEIGKKDVFLPELSHLPRQINIQSQKQKYNSSLQQSFK